MLVESHHDILDKDGFAKAIEQHPAAPQGIKLLSWIVREDQSHVTCAWETPSLDQLTGYAEPAIGSTAKSTYHKVHEAKSGGLHKEAAPPDDDATHLHNLGKRLAGSGKSKEAMAAFQLNAQLHPNEWYVTAGLARGHAAQGDFQNAVEYMKAALDSAPPSFKAHLQNLLSRLESGQNIN